MLGDLPHAGFVPESEEELRVVYDDGGGLAAEAAAADEAARAERGGRPRYGPTQPSSRILKPASIGSTQPAWQQQQQQQPLPGSLVALAGQLGGSGGTGGGSPRGETHGAMQHPQLTLAQELQGVLAGLGGPGQPQAEQQLGQPGGLGDADGDDEPGAWRPRPRRSGVRRIATTSPAIPHQAELPLPGGAGPPSGGRRWARAQAAAGLAGPSMHGVLPRRSPAAPQAAAPAPNNDGGEGTGGEAFFSVDSDLMQAHAQRQVQAAAGKGRQGARAVIWDSPQAPGAPVPAPAAADLTPMQPSQRGNPLAALLGSGSSSKPRAAATGVKARGRHPIYGHLAAPATASSQASQASAAGGALAGAATGSHLREQLGLRDAPLTSPRQAQQRRPAQLQHSRFAIRDAPPGTGATTAGGSTQHAAPARLVGAAPPGVPGTGLRQLTGVQPGAASRQQRFQPRPRRPASAGEDVVEEEQAGDWGEAAAGLGQGHAEWGAYQHGEPHPQQLPQEQLPAQQQHQQQQCLEQQGRGGPDAEQERLQQVDAAWRAVEQEAAGDAFRTPGQPLRRSWRDADEHGVLEQQQGEQQQQRQPASAAGGAPPSTGGSDRSARGAPGAMSLQRQFIAQLLPVSSSVAAATLQQQRQRLAGAAGLHARMQAILAAEKAGVEASPHGGAAAGAVPRLTVLQKELEGSITKCLCRCDGVAQRALHAPEVTALFQSRTAQRVDTAPGSVILLREPWRVMPVAGNAVPAVLCFAACNE